MSEAPHSQEAEEFLLGAMLLNNEVIDAICESVVPSDFYRPSNGIIYGAIVGLRNSGEFVDVHTVVEAIEAQGLMDRIDRSIFVSLVANVPNISHARSYARTVLDCALRRRLMSASQDAILKARDLTCSPEALLDEYRATIGALGSTFIDKEPDDRAVDESHHLRPRTGSCRRMGGSKTIRRGHKVMVVGGEGSGKSRFCDT